MDRADTASQIDLMKMAQQGDLNALAALMNRSLRVHGIFAELNLANGCLVVSAMFEKMTPNKTGLVEMLKRGLTNIHPKGVQRVMVQAMSIHDRSIAWQSAFVLPAKVEEPSGSALSSIAAKISGLPSPGGATVIQALPAQTSALEQKSDAKAPLFKAIQKQAIGGYLLLALGGIMMLTGLGQSTQSASDGDGPIYDAAALANKAIHSEAGGAMMISGAVLIAASARRP